MPKHKPPILCLVLIASGVIIPPAHPVDATTGFYHATEKPDLISIFFTVRVKRRYIYKRETTAKHKSKTILGTHLHVQCVLLIKNVYI